MTGRCHNVATTGEDSRGVQEPNRAVDGRRTQVHVELGRHQIALAGQLLDGARRCAPHRQMRTERMPQVQSCAVFGVRPLSSALAQIEKP